MDPIVDTSQPVKVRDFLATGKARMPLDLVAGERGLNNRISEPSINRPAFALTGFYQYFAHRRVQVFGSAEHSYLQSLPAPERMAKLDAFFRANIPCVVIARNRKVMPEIRQLSEEHKVPVLRTRMITGFFVNAATLVMESLSAKQTRSQGTMMEISGIGVLIQGKPGVGKSETALGLLRKGHALVSDDVTLLRVDSSGSIIAASVDVTRYHIEIRGLGIIHVPSLFGVSSVRGDKELDLIVSLYLVQSQEIMVREPGRVDIIQVLDVEVPHISILVAPGRDLANLVEAAALDHKLRMLGHDAAKELDEKLITKLSAQAQANV